jgi:ribonuclease BN (tRNA processing enzyme)
VTPPLRILGSAGWIPTGERETTSALLRTGGHAVVLDAGTGLRRLVTEPDLLDGVERVTIVLSHFHHDHTDGLAYAPALPDGVRVEVIGPGRALYGVPTAELVGRFVAPPFFPVPVTRMFAAIGDLEGEELDLAGLAIRWRRQERHSHPTAAFRFGDDLAFCTDTAYDPATAEFVRGTRVLLHEAVYAAERASHPDDSHSASGEAGRVAAEAGVERLVLIHRTIGNGTDEELLAHARRAFPATELAFDGMVVET